MIRATSRIVVTLTCLLVTILVGVVVSMSLGPDAQQRRTFCAEDGSFSVTQGILLEFGELPVIEDAAIAES
jgi:hypothetical protein